jgi:ubiquitin carboxyl-terminal hydrolase 25/28
VLPGKSLRSENRNAGKSLLSISMTMDSRNQMNEDLPEGHVKDKLHDLYVCRQCSIYCIVSGAMSGILALKYAEDFAKYRYKHPFIGRQPDNSVVSGWETLIMYVHQFFL